MAAGSVQPVLHAHLTSAAVDAVSRRFPAGGLQAAASGVAQVRMLGYFNLLHEPFGKRWARPENRALIRKKE